MSMKLYVGNISFNTSNQDLNDMFGAYGTVESANFNLNGKDVDGRELKVNEAKPRENSGGGGRGRSQGGGYGGGYGGKRGW